jgi:transcriptional regulator with XRE-family HTH domain
LLLCAVLCAVQTVSEDDMQRKQRGTVRLDGDIVREWRNALHLTQDELEEKAGIRRADISDIENMKKRGFNMEKRVRKETAEALFRALANANDNEEPVNSFRESRQLNSWKDLCKDRPAKLGGNTADDGGSGNLFHVEEPLQSQPSEVSLTSGLTAHDGPETHPIERNCNSPSPSICCSINPSPVQLIDVRSSLVEEIRTYYRALDRLDRTPWYQGGRMIRATDVAIPVRVLKDKPPSAWPEDNEKEPERRRESVRLAVDPEIAALYEEPVKRKGRKEVPWDVERRAIRRAVVLGSPGGGKTFLTDRTIVDLAREGLEQLERQCIALDMLPAPIHLHARDLAEAKGAPDEALMTLVRNKYKLSPRLEAWVRHALGNERGLLFIDALDEVKGDQLGQLKTRLETLDEWFPHCGMIVTCRTGNYDRGLVPWAAVTEYELAPFGPEDQRRLFERWFGRGDAKSTILAQAVERNYSLAHACCNPLVATLACLAHGVQALATETRRIDLYEQVLHGLIGRVWKHGGLPRNDRHIGDMMRLLKKIGLPLFEPAPEVNQFPDSKLLQVVAAASHEFDRGPISLRNELIDSGILVTAGWKSGELQYSFLHRSFLEHLAACGLENRGWDAIKGEADRRAALPAWQETIVCLAALLTDPEPLLELLADGQRDDIFRHRLALSALCLAHVARSKRACMAGLMDRITNEAISLWCRHRAAGTDAALSHIGRALPALGIAHARVDCVPQSQFLTRVVTSVQPRRFLDGFGFELAERLGLAEYPGELRKHIVEIFRPLYGWDDYDHIGRDPTELLGLLTAVGRCTDLWDEVTKGVASLIGHLIRRHHFHFFEGGSDGENTRAVIDRAAPLVGHVLNEGFRKYLKTKGEPLRDVFYQAWPFPDRLSHGLMFKICEIYWPHIDRSLAVEVIQKHLCQLRDPLPEEAAQAFKMAGLLSGDDCTPEIIETLNHCYLDEDETRFYTYVDERGAWRSVRADAIEAIGRLGVAVAQPQTVQYLHEGLRGGYQIHDETLEAIGRLGRAAATELVMIRLSQELNWFVKRDLYFAHHLDEYDDFMRINCWSEDAVDRNRFRILRVVGSLGEMIASSHTLDLLAEVLSGPLEQRYGRAAMDAFVALAGKSPSAQYTAKLSTLLSAQPHVRRRAATIVAKIPASDLLFDVALRLVDDPDKDVRESAIWAITHVVWETGRLLGEETNRQIWEKLCLTLGSANEREVNAATIAIGEFWRAGLRCDVPDRFADLIAEPSADPLDGLLNALPEKAIFALGYWNGDLLPPRIVTSIRRRLFNLWLDQLERFFDKRAREIYNAEMIDQVAIRLKGTHDERLKAAQVAGLFRGLTAKPEIVTGLVEVIQDETSGSTDGVYERLEQRRGEEVRRMAASCLSRMMSRGLRVFRVAEGQCSVAWVRELGR